MLRDRTRYLCGGAFIALLTTTLPLLSGCGRHRARTSAAVRPEPAPAGGAGTANASGPPPPVAPPPAHVTSDPRTVTATHSENVVHANTD
jgi:hypothetical protein